MLIYLISITVTFRENVQAFRQRDDGHKPLTPVKRRLA